MECTVGAPLNKTNVTSSLISLVPKFLVGVGEVFIDGVQMSIVSEEHLVGGGVLQHFGDGSQISPLLCGQLTTG